MKNLVISVSGGRSSAVMAWLIATSRKCAHYKKLFIFANTGLEDEYTLIFVRDLAKKLGVKIVWVEAVAPMTFGEGIEAMEVNYDKASRFGQPFSAIIDKYNLNKRNGVPNLNAPYCSDRLKTQPINKYAKEYFNGEPYTTAIGMRLEDTYRRISWAEVREYERLGTKIFPLLTHFDEPLNQYQIHQILINEIGIDLGIKSSHGNCYGCWKFSKEKSVEKFRAQERAGRWQWWKSFEDEYEDIGNSGRFYRGAISIVDLIKESRLPPQSKLFEEEENGCFCGA